MFPNDHINEEAMGYFGMFNEGMMETALDPEQLIQMNTQEVQASLPPRLRNSYQKSNYHESRDGAFYLAQSSQPSSVRNKQARSTSYGCS